MGYYRMYRRRSRRWKYLLLILILLGTAYYVVGYPDVSDELLMWRTEKYKQFRSVVLNWMLKNRGGVELEYIAHEFESLDELIDFLIDDDLNDVAWSPSYTCHNFVVSFIERGKAQGYYNFVYYALWDEELNEYIRAVESIEYTRGLTTWWYSMGMGPGHAVCKTTINGEDIIVDPQTDIVMKKHDGNFLVLYEGEITQK